MTIQKKRRFNFVRQFYCFIGDEGGDSSGDGGGSGDSVDGSASSSSETLEVESGWSGEEAGKTSPTNEFSKSIPEKYKDKPYLKDIDSVDKLYEQFDNAQTLIGKKTVGIPDENATDEDLQKFYENLRPKEAKDYEFEDLELPEDKKELQEFLKATRSETLDNDIKGLFHDAGLTKKQAAILYKGFNEKFVAHNEKLYTEAQEAYAKQNVDFESLAKKTWGEKKDIVLANAKALLNEHTPKAFKDHLGKLDNDSAIIMAATLENIRQKYIKEDGNPATGASSGKRSLEEIREEGRKLMTHPAYADSFHAEHEEIARKVKENYAALKKAQ